jgi:fatty-acyl-CoA synthase
MALVRDMVRDAVARHAARPALVTDRVTFTFGELGERVRRLATAFDEEGVLPTDIVGFVLAYRPELLYEIRFATYEHGAALFVIPPHLPPDVMIPMLRAVSPRLVIYDPDLFPGFPEIAREAIPGRPLFAAGGDDFRGRLRGVRATESTNPVDSGSLAALGFTSGTTGAPKGVTATHGASAASCRMLLDLPGVFHTDEARTAFNAVPLFAAGGGMMAPTLVAGMTTHVPDQWEPSAAAALLEREHVVFSFMTPSMIIDLLDLPDIEKRDFRSLEAIAYGSAITPVAKIEEAVRRIGPVFVQGYGMSECFPPVTALTAEEHGTREQPAPRNVLSSAGRPVAGVEVRIDVETADGVGEILIKSPTVTAGYWHDARRTAEALKDGWWHSGDVGSLDSDGRLHVLDRRADLLKRGGRTVYPRPIEEALSDHPAVKEAHAVQLPGSETIVAAVSLRSAFRGPRNGSGLEKELLDFAAARLDPAGRPDAVEVFPGDLPRSVQGKVLKREVRDALAAGLRT